MTHSSTFTVSKPCEHSLFGTVCGSVDGNVTDDASEFCHLVKGALGVSRLGLFCTKSLDSFKNLRTVAAQARYCDRSFTGAECVDPQKWIAAQKNESKAALMRQKGNTCFSRGDYVKALEAYNEALCLAPVDSESIGIAYANRSAIYLKTGFFQFCLENIELALKSGYPEKLVPKILERKEQCLKAMQNNIDSVHVYGATKQLKLSYPANVEIPSVAHVLRGAKNEKYGRHIVTSKDLKPGDVVLVEETYWKSLRKESVYGHCANCTSNNFYNLKPCTRTTCAMFCSDKCIDEAWKRFYKYESPIMDSILTLLPTTVSGAVRATLKAFTMFENPDDLKSLIQSTDVNDLKNFYFDQSTADEATKFRAFYSLQTNQDKRSTEIVYYYSGLTAAMWHVLKENTKMKEIFKNRRHEDLFLEILMKAIQIFDTNWYNMNGTFMPDPKMEDQLMSVIGPGISIFYSLFNHSCAPNTARLSINGQCCLVVIRPIKSGDQLFCSYGITFEMQPKMGRDGVTLSRNYYFTCDCEACKNETEYQTLDRLKNKKLIPHEVGYQAQRCNNDHRYDAKVKKDMCKVLAKAERQYPSADISTFQQWLTNMLLFYCFPKPLHEILSAQK